MGDNKRFDKEAQMTPGFLVLPQCLINLATPYSAGFIGRSNISVQEVAIPSSRRLA